MKTPMNYCEFYKNSKQRLTDSLVSMWASGHKKEQDCLRELLDEKEPLIAEPVFQTIFPWESSKETFEEHAKKKHILDEDFVQALSSIGGSAKEFCFPADRHPYVHQSKSWKGMLVDHQTIAVTTGTGSGKTECFMIPVLQDLYRERCKPDFREGVQAIFLYPLNALMKNQRERVHQWSKALPKPVTYAIYNGEMAEDRKIKGEYPQICNRPEMREHPPQILFTNPTMLNYMLVRSSDQPILEKSKGRLRWILLDEAHTYSGSSATELALQLRRVIDAFGVTVNEVNFAVTSATMGGKDAEEKLKGIVSQLTGKNPADIRVINGQRIIPELEKENLQQRLAEINKKHDCNLTLESAEKLRRTLNSKPALKASEIAKVANLKSKALESQLSLIDDLSTEVSGLAASGNAAAVLPTRAHFFIRALNGIFACVNPECKHKNEKSLKLGTFTTYQSAKCPHCGCNMVEVAECRDCGEFLIVGENSTEGYRLRTNEASLEDDPFGDINDVGEENLEENSAEQKSHSGKYEMFVYGRPQQNPRKIETQLFEFDAKCGKIKSSTKERIGNDSALVFQTMLDPDSGRDLCPCCGIPIRNRLQYLRASSKLLGRLLASTVLENATPMEDRANDKDILCEGRKYITFTDSRQGTAKSAMEINQDVERNWIRSEIYQSLAEKRRNEAVPQGLSEEEKEQLETFRKMPSVPPAFQKMYENLKKKKEGCSAPDSKPEEWKSLGLESKTDLKRMYGHLKDAKLKDDTTSTDYLNALFLDQFGWIPRTSNSLENLGLVHVVYPPLEKVKSPASLSTCKFSNDDWKAFLKICVDYQIRGGRHYSIPESSKSFLVQNSYAADIYDPKSIYEKGEKWPQVLIHGNKVKKPQLRQPRLVLLLMAALKIQNISELTAEKINWINTILSVAWQIIRDSLLDSTDRENKGYRLNLFDGSKVKLQILEKGWKCPVDNVVVDAIFCGYTPRMRGYATAENFSRFKVEAKPMEFPYFPYAGKEKFLDGKKEDVSRDEVRQWIDENWKIQKENGLVSNLHSQILYPPSIFMAGEHSAQQQSEVLANYEKEFNQGHLNILSCSTTMEMGVDLKGISAVVMNSVPPKPANYQQRAGRAGRRGETKALTLTFCTPNPVGINAWRNPMWPLEHQTEIPNIKLSSPQIVQRHINAFLFEAFVRGREAGMNVKQNVGDFFEKGESPIGYAEFCDFLQSLQSPAKQNEFEILDEHYQMLVKDSCLMHRRFRNRLTSLLCS